MGYMLIQHFFSQNDTYTRNILKFGTPYAERLYVMVRPGVREVENA